MPLTNPDWITEAADRERWRTTEWAQWEGLRQQLHEGGVETLTPADEGGGLYVGGRELIDLSEAFDEKDERPVLAALHRLAHRVSEHAQGLTHHHHEHHRGGGGSKHDSTP